MAKKQKRKYSSSTPAVERDGKILKSVDREFNPDYSYVIKDLRRIGMLAGTFFVILIVLSFIL